MSADDVLSAAQRRQRDALVARGDCSPALGSPGTRGYNRAEGRHMPMLSRGVRWSWRGRRVEWHWTCFYRCGLREPVVEPELLRRRAARR